MITDTQLFKARKQKMMYIFVIYVKQLALVFDKLGTDNLVRLSL